MLSLGLNQFIICQGFSNLGMVSVIIGAVLNILLDPLFIFALHMGVRGAAVATVLSQAASCAFSLYILFRGPVPVKITFRGYSLPVCRDVLTLGLTPFLIILFDNVLIIVQNVMLKNYGGADSDMLLTCNTIVQSFMLIITMPLSGISGGTQSVLGYNYGAGDTARIRLAEKHILKTALLFCTIMFVFAQWDVSAGIFVGLFTQNAAYRSMTVHFIHIYTLSVIPLAVQYALVDGLTGMSLVGASLPLSFFRKGDLHRTGSLFADSLWRTGDVLCRAALRCRCCRRHDDRLCDRRPRTPPQKRGAPRQTHRKIKRNACQKIGTVAISIAYFALISNIIRNRYLKVPDKHAAANSDRKIRYF